MTVLHDFIGQTLTTAHVPEAAQRRARELRRMNWQFLLPRPADGRFRRLILLGPTEPGGVTKLARDAGVAQEVVTTMPDRTAPDAVMADLVVRLHGARESLAEAAGAVAPGGLLYFEIYRRQPEWRRATPERIRRRLEQLGLTAAQIYWVRDSFADPRAYLPTEYPRAISWYFSHARYCARWTHRLAVMHHSVTERVGAHALVVRRMRCLAVVAARDPSAPPRPWALAVPDMHPAVRGGELRSVVLTPRLQRVVLLPFGPAARVPAAVVKVSRFALRNARTDHEQAVLVDIRRRLPERLRGTVPEPLGVHHVGDAAVGVESYLDGRLLGRNSEPWAGWSDRAHFRDLRAVADWLTTFHRDARLGDGEWNGSSVEHLDALLDEYERQFGLDAEERRLFAATRELAATLVGLPLARVWRHGDLTPRNTSRTRGGIGVIDWEHGSVGLPLMDLLHFVEEWLYNNAPHAPRLRDKLRRFHRVFVVRGERDRWAREVQEVVRSYMRRVGLDERFFPVLHVMLRVERALNRLGAAGDPDTDGIGLEMVDRYVGYVRALARRVDAALRAQPVPPAAPLRVLAWPAHARDNPYNALLYDALSRLGTDVVDFVPRALLGRRAAIWHLHWVENFWNRRTLVHAAWRAAAILVMVRVARWRGTRIVWTMHNLQAHERRHPRLERWFWNRFTRAVDGYIALGEWGRRLALQRFPTLAARPGFVVPHGHYRSAYPATASREQARRRLGLPDHASVVAFVGQVRPYKNVPHLIRTFRALTAPELRLVIAGRPNTSSLEQEVRAEAASDDRVHLSLRHVPDGEVQLFLRGADLVVLPYEDILNSGSALLALSFDRPVVVPDRGAMGELAQRVGSDWVRTYSGALTPAILADALRWAAGARGRRCVGLDALSWDELGYATLRAFTAVLENRQPAPGPEPGPAEHTDAPGVARAVGGALTESPSAVGAAPIRPGLQECER